MQLDSPRSFEYHKFVRSVLSGKSEPTPFSVVTEADFQRGSRINYPYRTYFFGIGVAHEDSRRLRIGARDLELRAKHLLCIGPGIPRLWLDDNWGLKNTTAFFTPQAFQYPFHSSFLYELPFFKTGTDHVISLSDEHYAFVGLLLAQMQQQQHKPAVVSGLLWALLAHTRQFYDERNRQPTTAPTRQQAIVRQFSDLIAQHHLDHADVAWYANQMHLTPGHLGEVIKAQTGKTAKSLLEETVMFEAQSLLAQTAMTVQEIAYWLHFSDPSYFTKAFTQHVGATPTVYRRSTNPQ